MVLIASGFVYQWKRNLSDCNFERDLDYPSVYASYSDSVQKSSCSIE